MFHWHTTMLFANAELVFASLEETSEAMVLSTYIRYFLEADKENVRVKNSKGQTALHIAAELDLADVAALLLTFNKDKHQARQLARGLSVDPSIITDVDDVDHDFSSLHNAVVRLEQLYRSTSVSNKEFICTSATASDDLFLMTCRDHLLCTPFSSAALTGSKNVLRLLFDHARLADMHNCLWNDILKVADLCQSSLLHLAVKSRSLPVVKMCLEQNIDIKLQQKDDGNTAMHTACELGCMKIIELFVEHDSSIVKSQNHQKQTPLHRAAVFCRDDVVAYLLSKGAEVDAIDIYGNTPLLCAACHGSTSAIEVLVQNGVNPTIRNHQGCTVLHAAVGHVNTMQTILRLNSLDANFLNAKDDNDNTALHYAALGGYYQNVVQLLDNGAHPNPRNFVKRIPLHIAAEKGWLYCVKRLISQSRTRRSINATDAKGKTPLHRAAAYGQNHAIDVLVHRGATVLRDSKGRTPLHYAALSGDVMSCKLVLHADSHCIYDRDTHGNTALHLAVKANHPDVVKFLLDSGAAFVMNNVDQNPLDEAIHYGNQATAIAIAEHDRWEDALRAKVRRVVVDVKSHLIGSADGEKVFRLKEEEKTQLQLMVEKMPKVALKFLDRCHVSEDVNSCRTETFNYRLLLGYTEADSDPHSSLDALRTMCECQSKAVLAHPVCCAFLNHKWKHYGWMYCLLACLWVITYVLLLSWYIVEAHPMQWAAANMSNNGTVGVRETSGYIRSLQYVITITTVIQMIILLFRLKNSAFGDLTTLTWLVAMVSCCCTLAFLLPFKNVGEQHKWVLGAISVFSGWITLVLWLRRVPYWGIFIVMVYKMFKRLFQVLIVIFLFTLAFGFAFYALLAPAADNVFIAFKNLPRASLKIFTMILGEIDFAELFTPNETNPNDTSVVPHIGWLAVLYIIFVLLMPVILMNLLIGLAVGDIEKVQKRASLEGYIMQVNLHLELEQSIPKFLLKKYWVVEEKWNLDYSHWRKKLWSLVAMKVDPDSNHEMEVMEERSVKLLAAVDRIEMRSVAQEWRMQSIQSSLDKLAHKLMPSYETVVSPSHAPQPMTFKDAALTVASRLRSRLPRRTTYTATGTKAAPTRFEIHQCDLNESDENIPDAVDSSVKESTV
ncbi:transient receptor potential cation channel subfamily A member 1-like isoform X2 [Corticium candelabrum]|uniref:transient receptor potential cation channel subfamily A member 1-like isoform X2 n=1 Tax=Corticium candelabrum TaxID=121492 RepID=UPI002E26C19E|nr:transient receptor potential cation channel subfamily A member 1-like isoform X2 [Corticium candelabrum]